MPEVRGIKG